MQEGTGAGGYKRVRAKLDMSYAVLRVEANSEASLLERNFTRLLREGAGNAAPRAPEIGATTSFNIVALANVPAETHVNEAWAASIQQRPISQAFNITHVTASRVNSTLDIKVPETRAILAIGETWAAPREETCATRAKTLEYPKGPIALT